MSNNRVKIIFSGGGSAGHVTPNLALISALQQKNWQIFYLGSKTGIERQLIDANNIPYFAISTGKLRRYFSWHNFIDPLKIIFGIIQAYFFCCKLKPDVIFAKGGFVAFPVVVAGWLQRIPVITHESDLTPGLANKLCAPFANKICLTFSETQKYFYFKDKTKIIVTGTPIRTELLHGNAGRGRELCGFNNSKKIILIYGGGLGATILNKVTRQLLPKLLNKFQIIHICGQGKTDSALNFSGYKQFSYLTQEFADILAAAAIVISRAGANTIYELLTLGKPHILIPLPKLASRGDQITNATHFAKLGFSQVIPQQELTADALYQKIQWLNINEAKIRQKLTAFKKTASVDLICGIIFKFIQPGI